MENKPADQLRSLRCSLSWSSYRELSPIRDQHELTEHEPAVALTFEDAFHASHVREEVSSPETVSDAHPAYRYNTRIAKDPKSFSDADFFAMHESLREKRSSQQFSQHAKKPFVVLYQKYSSAPIDEVIVSTQRTASTPIDSAKSPKALKECYEAREAPHTVPTDRLLHEQEAKPDRAACYWVDRVLSFVGELRAAKPTSLAEVIDDHETSVVSTVTEQARTDPLLLDVPPSSVINHLAQRFKDMQLRHAPSSGTLSSLGPLPDPLPAEIATTAVQNQKPTGFANIIAPNCNQDPVDEEYENEKVALFFALNIGRENKDADRRAADRKRLEHVAHLLVLLDTEPDSCKTQEGRLQNEKFELEQRLAKRMEKLKYDKDLDADAKTAADGQDLQCRRYAGNAAIDKPTNGMLYTSDPVYPATDVSFIERTGHIQLIGPPKYGGLATGILWIDGAHHEHPRFQPNLPHNAGVGCVCKNHQCFEAVTDDDYKYIGMARTKKEKKWVIHLATDKPNVGRWQIARKPVVEVNNYNNTTILEPVFEFEPEPQPETNPRPAARPAAARLLSGTRFYDDADSSSISSNRLAQRTIPNLPLPHGNQ